MNNIFRISTNFPVDECFQIFNGYFLKIVEILKLVKIKKIWPWYNIQNHEGVWFRTDFFQTCLELAI